MKNFIRIAKLAKPFWKMPFISAVMILLISFARQIDPWVSKFITDVVVKHVNGEEAANLTFIVMLLTALLGVNLLETIFNRVSWYYSSIFSNRFEFYLREYAFNHLTHLPVNFLDKNVSGELMSKIDRGADRVTRSLGNSLPFFLPNLVSALIALVVVARFDWRLALAEVLIFIPFIVITLLGNVKVIKYDTEIHKLYDKNYGRYYEAISALRLVKSFVRETFELAGLRKFNNRIHRLVKKQEKVHNWIVSRELIMNVWNWGIYAFVVYLTINGKFGIGTMVLMLTYLSMIKQPLWNLSWVYWEVKRAQNAAKEYFKILDEVPEELEAEDARKLEVKKGKIEFKNVHFHYRKGLQVLEGISIIVEPKQTVALVAPSGEGKTTIANLLLRFHDPQAGKILVDGQNIKYVTKKSLREQIGLVMQDAHLFADTVAGNLRYGKGDANLRQMVQACKAANAHEFIKKLPKGYDTKIGERGVKLSGGQKQRLSIARTLLKDPPILVLDEATSSLDSKAEKLVQDALWKLIEGRTTIIIAHRLSTVQRADKIYVLQGGKVVEEGRHGELIKKGGIYGELFRLQSGGRNE